MIDVSIIICSFNTKDITRDAIDSVIEKTKSINYELIVIDNASSDGSAEEIASKFPHIQLIKSKKNIGFARANNLAAKSAKGEYILLLNPDTILLNNAIKIIVDFARENPDYSIYGGKTYYPDQSLNPTAAYNASSYWSLLSMALGFSSFFPRSKIFNPEGLDWWKWNKLRVVDTVIGCFLLMKKHTWQFLKGFDTRYFMYGEDADLCQRARYNNFGTCIVNPDARLIHYGGASEKIRAPKMIRLFIAKAVLFSKKASPIAGWYGRFMLSLYAWTRMMMFGSVAFLSAGKMEYYRNWKKIWQSRDYWNRKSITKILNSPPFEWKIS